MNSTERGFRRIFWGLIFVVLDLRIDGFDLLPDFVGFGIIASGLGLLVPLSLRFHTARIMAMFLVVFSLATLIRFTDGTAATTPFGGWFYFQLIVDVIDITMIWQLCGGIIDLARERDLEDLALRANTRRALYVGLSLMTYALVLVAMDGPSGDLGVFAVGLVIFMIVVVCLLMGLMLRAARELGDPAYEDYDRDEDYD